ncbi:beta-1,3-galactosyltransferase 4-like [Pristis pectinata]|uniref:beta-1,3-galactosyltransferase 4-like n=1 Tax=Pristis pectinata TaxID=685728 RepID=UPI00223CFBC2|nr:beta-1,3-galactosyltransferase 4-like [Pristis pectinata]XP_051899708.1 beta-1,3-galactosyltransferase 4-like [Pristis pectinata]XP_051899709.1 beta-1,3-galactosyltransferase 4-like [Pristis pectinata]XP_051899710.1 beta-1,3-galactosyltransferase 4-like [Pristis pectinata]XP_051899711.1 beta-1,3-galactosyltransferase 4-like [Pristis pectinata]XP_051899713.1 beta-1,3-galactosyltransferase 4-like [Pristis pectinata]XP_051899714.1 beta-1,3-galactosyltransferase 4-like [Pristis pectinata]
MRCPLPRRWVPWALQRLALPAALLLLLAVLSLGWIEEWVLSPRGELPEGWPEPSVSRVGAGPWAGHSLPGVRRLPNPGACTGQRPVFLLALVPSSPGHQRQRQAIRASWGSLAEVDGHQVRTLFALGLPASAREARLLEAEAAQHGDLLQGRFADTYRNLTLKTLMALGWARQHCPAARFLLKADDDVFVNVRALVAHLGALVPAEPGLDPGPGPRPDLSLDPGPDLYLGRVHASVRVQRDPASPYYVPEAAHPAPTFPRYCSGTAYVLSRAAADKVLSAARRLPLIPVEDAFVGVCARAAGLQPTPSARMSGSQRLYPLRCCLRHAWSSHHVGPAELPALWALVERGGECGALRGLAALLVCNSLSLWEQLNYLWAWVT